MTTLREAAQQALEALEGGADSWQRVGPAIDALRAALAEPPVDDPHRDHWVAIAEAAQKIAASTECGLAEAKALCAALDRLTDAALAEPVQEPVAWLFTNLQSGDYDFCYQEDEHDHDREMWHKQPLYSAPPQRKPLTREEAIALWADKSDGPSNSEIVSFARAIERAHGIRGEE